MKKQLLFGYLVLLNTCSLCQTTDFTEIINNWSIQATETDSTNFPPYFEYQKEIDSITKNYSNWHQLALAVEKFQIQKYTPDIKIEDGSRIVRLQDGSEIELIPNFDFDEVEYTFEKEFKNLDLLLFRVQWDEGNNYFLLNTNTGHKTYTIGKVFFNKDSNLFLSINGDIESSYSDNGFQLFRIQEDGMIKELWKISPNWAPEKIKWIDNETLIVQGYYFSESDNLGEKNFYKLMKIKEH